MKSNRGARFIAAVALCAGIGLDLSAANALPLTEDACKRFAAERQTLLRLGVREHVLKGAQWARANLTEPQLDLIHRYIRIDEALKFRCPEEYAALPVEQADKPRRLDVTPPMPARKPAVQDGETGVTQVGEPPPPAKGPNEQS